MKKTAFLLLLPFSLLLSPLSLCAQYDPEAKTDPLGRPYRPIVGVLEPVVYPGVPAEIGKFLGIAFSNGANGNAYTPYGVVNKPRLKDAVKIAAHLDREQMWRHYYYEGVGVEYLLQLEILHFSRLVTDDPPEPGQKPKRVFHYSANLTARLTDVATSKVLTANHFTISSNSLNVTPQAGRSDSLLALQQLYKLGGVEANRMLTSLITGVGQITAVHEAEGDKAVSVIMSNSPLTAGPKHEQLDVFALQEVFSSGDLSFIHAERIGVVAKPDDYDYKVRQYKVKRGKPEIAALLKSGKTLVACKSLFPPRRAQPSLTRPSVLMEAFINKTSASSFRVRFLEDALAEYLSRYPQLLDVVDREMYALVEAERKMQQIRQSDATQGSISIGADYLMTAEVTELKIERDIITTIQNAVPVAVSKDSKETKDTKDKRERMKEEKPILKVGQSVPSGVRASAQAKVEIRVVSVKTGEVALLKTIRASATKEYPYDLHPAVKEAQDEELNKLLTDNFALAAGPVFFHFLNGKSPVLKLEEEQVLIGGGFHAGFRDGMEFEVVEISEEVIDGQTLLRETPIALLKATEVFPETTRCKIKKGDAQLLASFGRDPRRLYVRVKGG